MAGSEALLRKAVVCSACDVRLKVGENGYDPRKEPFGEKIVCESCFLSLQRRNLTVTAALELERRRSGSTAYLDRSGRGKKRGKQTSSAQMRPRQRKLAIRKEDS